MPEVSIRVASSADALALANLPGQWDSPLARPEFAPDLRSRGIGKAMMNALDEMATELGLILQTVNSSAEGIPLYEATGFASTPQLLRKRHS